MKTLSPSCRLWVSNPLNLLSSKAILSPLQNQIYELSILNPKQTHMCHVHLLISPSKWNAAWYHYVTSSSDTARYIQNPIYEDCQSWSNKKNCLILFILKKIFDKNGDIWKWEYRKFVLNTKVYPRHFWKKTIWMQDLWSFVQINKIPILQ